MLQKTKQQIRRYRFTYSNRLPNLRSREYLLNQLRRTRLFRTSPALRAAMGLVRWSIFHSQYNEDRIKHRAFCIVSGRPRGTSQRHAIARTKIRDFVGLGRLPGVKKSSW